MWVYVLRSLKDGRRYIGSTQNVETRLQWHNDGRVKATCHRRPLIVVYKEFHDTLISARRRETALKRMKGGVEFKRLLEPGIATKK